MKSIPIIGIVVAVALFILFLSNTDFQGMDAKEIWLEIRIFAVIALIIGGVITYKTGVNFIMYIFVGLVVGTIILNFIFGG